MNDEIKQSITGVILAGGQARRMGGEDKGLIQLNGKAMIEHVLDKLRPQVTKILINANRNHEHYSKYGCPLIADDIEGFCGPLAGFASSMPLLETDLMLAIPCDSPFVPTDLAQRLYKNMQFEDADISVAHNGERLQPVFCLLKKELLSSLQNYLDKGERKIDRWFQQHKMTTVDFSDQPQAFLNINTPEELAELEKQTTNP